MTKRLLGTFKIFYEPDSKATVSRSNRVQDDVWEITINPDSDKATPDMQVLGSKSADILAHELGHAVAQMLGAPGHRFSREYDVHTPAELEAWQIAEHIKGNIDIELVKAALGTYVKNGLMDEVVKELGPQALPSGPSGEELEKLGSLIDLLGDKLGVPKRLP